MNEYLRWACGALTDGMLVVSTDASDFRRMWIDPCPDDEPGRLAARHGLFTRAARPSQDGLVEAAIAAGDCSPTERPAQLIAWPKDSFPQVPAYGLTSVPLILVRPVERVRAGPEADGILVVDPRSEVRTTRGLIAMGWLEGAVFLFATGYPFSSASRGSSSLKSRRPSTEASSQTGV